MISPYLLDIIILLFAAVVAVPLSRAARLGAVPGFLIAGVIVGPSGLGLISNISEIGNLAEIGVVLLLFVIGIELKPSRLWKMKRLVFGLGTLQVTITGVLIGAVSYIFFDFPLGTAILVGLALALSSTAFVLQLLSEQKLLTSIYGRASFSVLLLQDLAVVPLLIFVPLLAMPELSMGENIGLVLAKSLLILGSVVLLGRYFLHPLLHRVALSNSPEVFTASAVLIVLGTALVTEHAGLSMAMGAFLAGLLISDSFYRHQVLAEIQPFRGLLLGLFFMSMGMSLNLDLLIKNPLFAFGMVALLVFIKAAVLFPLARCFGLKNRDGIAIALVLAEGGEFAMVIFSLAFQSNVLTEELFQQLLLIVLLSMLTTPVLADVAKRLIKDQYMVTDDDIELPVKAPIVLVGFGRVGHRIGEILSLVGKSFVALDSNALLVSNERAKGNPVYYGDVRNHELLEAAGARNAQTIVVTLNDPDTAEVVVSSLRKTHPEINIFVRGHNLDQCRKLRKLGASAAVSENVEASLELARMVLISTGYEKEKREAVLDDFRQIYHAQIDDEV
ncbi:MAG: monovalent cation:proton antiporter-2 (CPA2) family protein [Gammaproteobacteria bacterium]|nr:monovalent cation:proton antiporter-2 (CPA2) family protein [Gammaproteobacteria bacterium]